MQMIACKVCVRDTLILDPNLILCPRHPLTSSREQFPMHELRGQFWPCNPRVQLSGVFVPSQCDVGPVPPSLLTLMAQGLNSAELPPYTLGCITASPVLISLSQGQHCSFFVELEGEENLKFSHKMKAALFILDPLKNPQLLARRVIQQAAVLRMVWAFSDFGTF